MPERRTATAPRRNAAMLAEVTAGLAQPQKELPPKYFYDQRGSELFEEITRLPEYYPTRTERTILQREMPVLVRRIEARTLVELGAGSAEKSRIILDAMTAQCHDVHYVPIDVSATFLELTARRLREEYPGLRVLPVVADVEDDVRLPRGLPNPVLYAFLGSTIGNFYESQAIALLRRIGRVMRAGDRLLLGADLRKDVRRLEAAYNDARGVTAAFNRNMLSVLNQELGADFDPESFAHLALYVRGAHRIEMHLVSRRDQQVHIPGLPTVCLYRGESIRTEISCKYDRATIERLLANAGLRLLEWLTDPESLFAVAVAGTCR
jgi:L-histidine N-alpha-methyltransferase